MTEKKEVGVAVERGTVAIQDARPVVRPEDQFAKRAAIVGLSTALALVFIGCFVVSIQRGRRSSAIARLQEDVEITIESAKNSAARFDFSEAFGHLDAGDSLVQKSAFPNKNLEAGLNNERAKLLVIEQDYMEKLEKGYKIIGGQLFSPKQRRALIEENEKRSRLLEADERKKRSEDDARKAVEEKRERRLRSLAIASASWQQYLTQCGAAAQQENAIRSHKLFSEKYAGSKVKWVGRVHRIREEVWGKDCVVEVKMSPTESVGSDVSLVVSNSKANTLVGLNRGDDIEFEGSLAEQGNSVSNHEVRCEHVKKLDFPLDTP